jgi:EmrB/QacA subfamily drug resistance transporter
MQLASSSHGRLPYKWIVVMVVILGSFMSIMDQTVVNNALPALQHAFSVNLGSLQWVLTAYTLTQGVVTPVTAFFANRLGTKRFYIVALALFTAGSALCGLAWNLPILIVFRVVQAIGGATLFPLAVTLLFSEFPPQQRGLATGILSTAALAAPALGPTIGGYLVTYASWPLIFYLNVPIGIVGVILAVVLLRELPSNGRARFDVPGFILVATGLAATLYALSNASIAGWGDPSVLILLASGLCLLILFVVVEVRTIHRDKQPLITLQLFLNRSFLTSNIANAMISFSFFGSIVLLSVYMQEIRGMSAFEAGLYTVPLAATSVLTSLLGGRVIDRFGPRATLFPGLILMGLSTWLMAEVTLTTPYPWLVVIYAARGLGLGCLLQALTVAALSKVERSQFTQASSLNSVVRFTFTALGVTVLTTFAQGRASSHISALVRQLKPVSPAALDFIQRSGLNLAIQEAFWLSLAPLVVAFLAVAFLRVQKAMPPSRETAVKQEVSPAARV